MNRVMIVLLSTLALSLLASGCVTKSEFKAYKAEAERVDSILLCESRNDAYEDMMNSDEPDPTRRDEPDGTRRDIASCDQEFSNIVNSPHLIACRNKQSDCVDKTALGGSACRACYMDCLSTGAWDNVACPVP